MFIIKKNYYLYIKNTTDINLNHIKKSKKIYIIYRNNIKNENIEKIIKFRKKSNARGFKFFVSNNLKLLKDCKADGLYVSSYNTKNYHNKVHHIIGSAHNFREIYQKIKQGCKTIILSRLFKTSYVNKKNNLGVLKFNLIKKNYVINIVPLGGINKLNLLKLNMVNADGFALLSEVKKKPVIANRLF
jgi:thiamine monophosphate synthase